MKYEIFTQPDFTVQEMAALIDHSLLMPYTSRAEMDAFLDEVKRYARRRPGTFLAGAAVLGLVAGRLTRGVVAEKQVYSVLSCGTPMSCQYFDRWFQLRAKRLSAFGTFEYSKVFELRTGSAQAAVFRISNATGREAGGHRRRQNNFQRAHIHA